METNSYVAIAVVVALILAMMFFASRRKNERRTAFAPAVQPPMPLPLPDQTIDEANPMAVFDYTGRRPGDKHHCIECDVLFDGFFEANRGDGREGHFIVMTRADVSAIPTRQYRGIGWIAGTLYAGNERAPFPFPADFTDRACCESWRNGKLPDPAWPWLKADTVTHRLRDGQVYRAVFASWPMPGGWGYRFLIDGYDTGDQYDDNTDIDPAEQALGFAVSGRGCVKLSHILSTWS